MILDLHIHSNYSADGTASPKEILKNAVARGLGGLAITDHNTIEGTLKARALAEEMGLILVRGMEISTADGHILAYGIDAPIKRGMSASETVLQIRKVGGFASVAHPFRWWSGVGEEVARKCKPHALETFNGRSKKRHNDLAERLRGRMGAGMTAGSDAHSLEDVGRAYVDIPGHPESETEVLEALMKGNAKVGGRSRSASESARYGYKSVTQWAGRGFKRM